MERKKIARMREKLNPTDLTPMDELVVCNKLMTPRTLERIQWDVLEGVDPVSIARQNGWECGTKPLSEVFGQCREEMAAKRENRIPTNEEERESIWKIQQLVFRLSRGRRGWYQIDQEYKALRFLYSISGEFKGSQEKVDKLLDILFPTRHFTVDSRTSFLVPPGS